MISLFVQSLDLDSFFAATIRRGTLMCISLRFNSLICYHFCTLLCANTHMYADVRRPHPTFTVHEHVHVRDRDGYVFSGAASND